MKRRLREEWKLSISTCCQKGSEWTAQKVERIQKEMQGKRKGTQCYSKHDPTVSSKLTEGGSDWITSRTSSGASSGSITSSASSTTQFGTPRTPPSPDSEKRPHQKEWKGNQQDCSGENKILRDCIKTEEWKTMRIRRKMHRLTQNKAKKKASEWEI